MKTVTAKEIMLSKEVLNLNKKPAPVFTKDLDKYKYRSINFAMTANIEITKGGRLFSTWIGGEDGPESYMMLTYSDDKGETWKDLCLVIDPRSDEIPYSRNTHIGTVWCDPDGRLWLFYQQVLGIWEGEGANLAIICDNPDADELVWSEPRLISPGASIKKPIVLENGEWLLPVSIWERWYISKPFEDLNHDIDYMRGSSVFVSKDKGETWSFRGGLQFDNSYFNEHSIAKLSDGRLMMISRCKGETKKSYSNDDGKTWSPEEHFFEHVTRGTGSMATIRKLRSGNLLLVKHGTEVFGKSETRSDLTAFISKDDGKTWLGGLTIDERMWVTYPGVAEAEDGTIYVQYDYERYKYAEILFARFREEDVLAGRLVSEGSALKQVIKDLSGIKGTENNLYKNSSESFSGGEGTKDNPYLIKTPEDFIYFTKMIYKGNTFEDKFIVLDNDIDFKGEEIYQFARDSYFSGNFNGKGHSIMGFNILGTDFVNRGILGQIKNGTVKNLTLKNAKICGCNCIGAIAGLVSADENKTAVIENCIVEKSVEVLAYINIGSVVGYTVGNVKIINCRSEGKITIPRTSEGKDISCGGILGGSEGETEIIGCNFSGEISSKYAININVGGIFGKGNLMKIENSNSNCDIKIDTTLEKVRVGKIAGELTNNGEIINCSSDNRVVTEICEWVEFN